MANILLADDHPAFREPIRALLEREGHSVQAVGDGIAAIAAIAARAPDLILLDMKMPGVGGGEVLAYIRRAKLLLEIPVIVMTIRSDKRSVLEVARLGVSAYLLKDDFSLDRMLEAVRLVIQQSAKGGCPSAARTPASGDPASADPALVLRAMSAGLTVPALATGGSPGRAGGDVRLLLRSIEPLMPRGEVAERIASAGEFRGLSPAVTEILTLTASSSCTIDAVAAAIGQDPGVALRVIRLANSSAYSRGAAVDSVRRAVVQIGLRKIRQTILALGAVERFSAPAFESRLSTGEFWEHSFACGVIAAEITRATGRSDADAAFICGLLHDVGRVILAEQLGDAYVRVLDTARELQLPLEQVETRMLSINHADIMGEVVKRWRLPEALGEPIAFHHAPTGALRSAGMPFQVLRLIAANRLAHALMLGSSGNDTVAPTAELCSQLGIGAETMTRITGLARQQTREIAAIMLSGLASPETRGSADAYRTLLQGSFRPLFVAAAPALDAHRLLCDELAGPAAADPSTIIVAYAARDEDGLLVSQRIRAAESDAGASGLPVLVLSPRWGLELDRTVLGGRTIELLKTPVSIPRFIMTVNGLSGSVRLSHAAPIAR